jgi:hypothetical protein
MEDGRALSGGARASFLPPVPVLSKGKAPVPKQGALNKPVPTPIMPVSPAAVEARKHERFPPQFARVPLSVESSESSADTLLQLQSYIVFDEYIGSAFSGSDPEVIRRLFIERSKAYVSAGVLISGDPALTVRTLQACRKTDLLLWNGHSIASVRGAGDRAYFINTGGGCTRNGVPEQLKGSPYRMVHGILQFDGISQSVYDEFVRTPRETVMADGSMFYTACISQLVLRKSDVMVEDIVGHTIPVSSYPHVTGVPYTAQECGNCTFRSTSLGMLAAMIDARGGAATPGVAHDCTVAFMTWMFEIFLFEAPTLLDAFPLSVDLIALVAHRLTNSVDHLVALGADRTDLRRLQPKVDAIWNRLKREHDALHVSVANAPTQLPGPAEMAPVMPLDRMKIGSISSDGVIITSADARVPQNATWNEIKAMRERFMMMSSVDRDSLRNLYVCRIAYAVGNWYRSGTSDATFEEVCAFGKWWGDYWLSDNRKNTDPVAVILTAVAVSKSSVFESVEMLDKLRGFQVKNFHVMSDVMTPRQNELVNTALAAMKSTPWGMDVIALGSLVHNMAKNAYPELPADHLTTLSKTIAKGSYTGPNAQLKEASAICKIAVLSVSRSCQLASVDPSAVHEGVFTTSCSTGYDTHSSYNGPEDLTLFLEKLASCSFSFGDISPKEDPFTMTCGLLFADPEVDSRGGIPGHAAHVTEAYVSQSTAGGVVNLRSFFMINTSHYHRENQLHFVDTHLDTFRSVVASRLGDQGAVESVIERYLTRLDDERIALPVHEVLYAVFASCHLWNIMGYDDTTRMSAFFGTKEALVEFVTDAALTCKDPLRNRAIRTRQCYDGLPEYSLVKRQYGCREDRVARLIVNENDDRIHKLMPLSAAMLPFVRGDAFEALVNSCISQVFDPKSPYASLIHVLYGDHVYDRFLKVLDGDMSANYKSYTVATVDGRSIYTYSREGKSFARLSDIMPPRDLFKRRHNDYVEVTFRGRDCFWTQPPCVPYYVSAFQWERTLDGAWSGTPKSDDFVKATQYCLLVDGRGARKCSGGAGRQDADALACGACGHVMVDVHSLMKDAYTAELLKRLSEVCFEEDVVAWRSDDSVLIDLVPYGAMITIHNGRMYVGASMEYEVTERASHWTHRLKNAVHLRKRDGSGEAVGLFERVIKSKATFDEFAASKVFKPEGDEAEDYSGFETNFHVIPVHYSGLTLVPSDARAAWAYVSSCLVYKRTALALEVHPIYHAMNATLEAPFKVEEFVDNWPLMLEACYPKFHATLAVGRGASPSAAFGYDDKSIKNLKAKIKTASKDVKLSEANDFKAQLGTFAVDYSTREIYQQYWPQLKYSVAVTQITYDKIAATLTGAACSVKGYPATQPVERYKRALASMHEPGPARAEHAAGDFYIGLPPSLSVPLKVMIVDPAALAAKARFGGAVRKSELMFYFIKGIVPRRDQLDVVAAITADLSGARTARGRIHPMLMGSGKTAVVTPLVIIESHYSSDAPAIVLVVPPPLLHQSAIMLARDLSPYSLVPVGTYFASTIPVLPGTGMCHVMEDGVHKQVLIARAAKDKDVRAELARYSYIFDEMDTLINPLTSELNIPKDVHREPDVPMVALYLAVYSFVGGWRNPKDVAAWPKGVRQEVIDHYLTIVEPVLREKKHRQHFGSATQEEYALANKGAAKSLAVPFVYADTPVIGSKYSDIVFSMATTAACYVRSPLRADQVLKTLVALSSMAYSERKQGGGCDTKYVPPEDVADVLRELGKDCFSVTEESQVPKAWLSNKVVKWYFAKLVTAKEFALDIELLNASGVDMVMSGNGRSRSGFTGTPEKLGALELYDSDALQYVPKRNEDVLDEEAAMRNTRFMPYYGGSFMRYLEAMIERKAARVIIDCGCEMVGVTPSELFRLIVSCTDTDARLVYWRKTGERFLMSVENDVPWDGVDDGKLFVYYAHANTTGTDAKLKPDTRGLLTLGKDTRTRDFTQALFRLRQIAKTQTCIVTGDGDVLAKALGVVDSDLKWSAVVDWMANNDVTYNRRQNENLVAQCIMANCRCNDVLDAVPDNDTMGSDSFLTIVDTVVVASTARESEELLEKLFVRAKMDQVQELVRLVISSRGSMVESTSVSQDQDTEADQEAEQDQENEQDADIMQLLNWAYAVDVTIAGLFAGKIQGLPLAPGLTATRLCCLNKRLLPDRPAYVFVSNTGATETAVVLDTTEAVNAISLLMPRRDQIAQDKVVVIVSENFGSAGNGLPLFVHGQDTSACLRFAAETTARVRGLEKWPDIKIT